MKKGASQKICIVIPAYNEAAVIRSVINDLQKVLNANGYSPLIVVVDDGSKDDTAIQAATDNVHVIPHILNSGSGGATATGLRYAHKMGYDIAVTVDADGQHDPDDVVKGIKEMKKGEFDLLIGSRLIDSQGMSGLKQLGNKGLSVITYVLFGVNVTDSQSGLRVFSRKALAKLKWKTNGYEFCSEMLWRAKQQHLKISEYPIKAIYTEYSKSKGQNNWNGFNIVKALLRHRLMEFLGE